MYQLTKDTHGLNSLHKSISDEDLFKLFNDCFVRHQSGDGQVYVEGFLSGNFVVLSDATLKEISILENLEHLYAYLDKIGLSLRLNNVHLISDDISAYTTDIFKASGDSLSCNMYFTPKSGKRCLKLHSDKQTSKALQLRGSKKWSFPLDVNGEFIKSFDPLKIKSLDSEKSEEVILDEGNLLEFNQGIAHKTDVCSGRPSIHITFANRHLLKNDFFDAAFMELRRLLESTGQTTDVITTAEEEKSAIDSIQKCFDDLNFEKILTQIKQSHERTKIMNLKKGRGSRAFHKIV